MVADKGGAPAQLLASLVTVDGGAQVEQGAGTHAQHQGSFVAGQDLQCGLAAAAEEGPGAV